VTGVLDARHARTWGERIARIRAERTRMRQALTVLPITTSVLPSEANFLLVRVTDAADALARACAAGLLVRDARGYAGLEDALRVSIGTPEQNDTLLRAWS